MGVTVIARKPYFVVFAYPMTITYGPAAPLIVPFEVKEIPPDGKASVVVYGVTMVAVLGIPIAARTRATTKATSSSIRENPREEFEKLLQHQLLFASFMHSLRWNLGRIERLLIVSWSSASNSPCVRQL